MDKKKNQKPINKANNSAKAGKQKNWDKYIVRDAKGVPEILDMHNPVLHQKSEPVLLEEIASTDIQAVIKDMIKALESQEDGIGIAAPQIGVPLRIFVVAGFVFDRIQATGRKSKSQPTLKKDKINPHQIFINPTIIKYSKDKKWMEGEGCLSVRWFYGSVERSTRVTLRAYNEKGQMIERGASGILAHIFQHEVDHLDGVLFTDKAIDIQEFDPEEIRKELKKRKREDVGL